MSSKKSLSHDICAKLAQISGTNLDDWFLVFRARYGMEAVFSVLYEKYNGGEVITQPFTCATAVNPILTAGLIPTYIDANYNDLSLDTNKLHASSAGRALVMQHSFGIESNMSQARTFANKHHLLLVEDSSHHVGMMSRKEDSLLADVSIHSFGVEKFLPTKFGGAVWINPNMKDTALRDSLRQKLALLPVVNGRTARLARRYRIFNGLLNHTPAFIEPGLRSIMVATGCFQPAITSSELLGKNNDKACRPNRFILEQIQTGLKQYSSLTEKRSQIAKIYRQNLPDTLQIPKHMSDKTNPVRFPVLAKNPRESMRLFDALRANGHYSGRWYRPTLFPGVTDYGAYNYDPESCPIAEDIASRILNLPTNISTKEAKEIVDVLQRATN